MTFLQMHPPHRFDPQGGEYGRGWILPECDIAEITATMREAGFSPHDIQNQDATAPARIPVVDAEGLPTGFMWFGYERVDGDKWYVNGFESPATDEEISRLLDSPFCGASGAVFRGTVRSHLTERGIDPNNWLKELTSKRTA